MPRTINPIRKALLKQSILENKGRNVQAAMIKAGYTKSTAKRTYANASVKVIQAEILEDIKGKITEEYILSELERAKKICERKKSKDMSSFIRACELLGKWRAMFTDKQEVAVTEQPDNQFSMERLSRLKAESDITN